MSVESYLELLQSAITATPPLGFGPPAIQGRTSGCGTFRKWREVRLGSAMRCITDMGIQIVLRNASLLPLRLSTGPASSHLYPSWLAIFARKLKSLNFSRSLLNKRENSRAPLRNSYGIMATVELQSLCGQLGQLKLGQRNADRLSAFRRTADIGWTTPDRRK
jgi:hypothetical protein